MDHQSDSGLSEVNIEAKGSITPVPWYHAVIDDKAHLNYKTPSIVRRSSTTSLRNPEDGESRVNGSSTAVSVSHRSASPSSTKAASSSPQLLHDKGEPDSIHAVSRDSSGSNSKSGEGQQINETSSEIVSKNGSSSLKSKRSLRRTRRIRRLRDIANESSTESLISDDSGPQSPESAMAVITDQSSEPEQSIAAIAEDYWSRQSSSITSIAQKLASVTHADKNFNPEHGSLVSVIDGVQNSGQVSIASKELQPIPSGQDVKLRSAGPNAVPPTKRGRYPLQAPVSYQNLREELSPPTSPSSVRRNNLAAATSIWDDDIQEESQASSRSWRRSRYPLHGVSVNGYRRPPSPPASPERMDPMHTKSIVAVGRSDETPAGAVLGDEQDSQVDTKVPHLSQDEPSSEPGTIERENTEFGYAAQPSVDPTPANTKLQSPTSGARIRRGRYPMQNKISSVALRGEVPSGTPDLEPAKQRVPATIEEYSEPVERDDLRSRFTRRGYPLQTSSKPSPQVSTEEPPSAVLLQKKHLDESRTSSENHGDKQLMPINRPEQTSDAETEQKSPDSTTVGTKPEEAHQDMKIQQVSTLKDIGHGLLSMLKKGSAGKDESDRHATAKDQTQSAEAEDPTQAAQSQQKSEESSENKISKTTKSSEQGQSATRPKYPLQSQPSPPTVQELPPTSPEPTQAMHIREQKEEPLDVEPMSDIPKAQGLRVPGQEHADQKQDDRNGDLTAKAVHQWRRQVYPGQYPNENGSPFARPITPVPGDESKPVRTGPVRLPKNMRAVRDSTTHDHDYGRTIVVCLDGTGDKFDDDNSNIVHLVSALKKDDKRQVTYYQAGIGTYTSSGLSSGFEAAADMAVGSGLGMHVRDAYHFLMHSYKEGDKICIFGFSRGAYTARCLAGMIHKVGLLPPRNIQQIQFAYEFYKDDTADGWLHSAQFKTTFSIDVSVWFLGCFDSVASVGFIPRQLPLSGTPTSKARYFRHAMSLDERRAKFKVCRHQQKGWADIEKSNKPKSTGAAIAAAAFSLLPNVKAQDDRPPGVTADDDGISDSDSDEDIPRRHPNLTDQEFEDLYKPDESFKTDVLEVWFAGCHADVGGGAVPNIERHKLAEIPLRWMIRQAFECNTGIIFRTKLLAEHGLDIHTLWPKYERLPVPKNDPSPTFLEKYHKALPPRHVRRNKLKALHRDQGGEKLYHLESLDDDDWTPEQVEDFYDAMMPMNDQLVQAPSWWILEVWPVQYKVPVAPGKAKITTGMNWGRYRAAEEERPKMHWTVKKRMEHTGYKIYARTAPHVQWEIVA